VPADRGLALHHDHLVAGVGDVQRRLDAGDPAAQHERGLGDRHLDGVEGLVLFHLLDHLADQVGGLRGRGIVLLVDPRAMLADIRHLAQVGVQPRLRAGPPERGLVHVRRAGAHDDAVELVLLYGVLDHGLPRVGAHVFVVNAVHDARYL